MPADANAHENKNIISKSSAQNGVNTKKKKKNKNKNKNDAKNASKNQHEAQTQGAKPKAFLSPPAAAPLSSTKKGGSLLDQMRQKLQGGQFRWLNEQLYTTAGDNALSLMRKNPELYNKYHEGKPKSWRWLKRILFFPSYWFIIALITNWKLIMNDALQNLIYSVLTSTYFRV
jgi:hypothetical protein